MEYLENKYNYCVTNETENRNQEVAILYEESKVQISLENSIDKELMKSVPSQETLNQNNNRNATKYVKAKDFIETLFQIITEENNTTH